MLDELCVLEADDLMNMEDTEQKWILPGLIPAQGLTLLVAPKKAGKSMISLALAIAVASGKDFLGMPTAKGGVLLLDYENGPSRLARRFKALANGMSLNASIPFTALTPRVKLLDAMEFHKLYKVVEERRPSLLIIDCLYKSWSGDENKAGDVNSMYDLLEKLRSELGCSILLLHHEGKDFFQRGEGRGSSALPAAPDSNLCIARSPRKGCNRLMLKNSRDGSDVDPVDYVLEDADGAIVIKVVGDSEKKTSSESKTSALDQAKEAVLALLKDRHEIPTGEALANLEEQGIARATAKRAISALAEVDDSLIDNSRRGLLRLAA